MEQADGDILRLFDGKPMELELYLRLAERIFAAFPGVRRKVCKTQVSFANRYNFAFASLPVRKVSVRPDRYLIVTFGLGYRRESPRIEIAVEPYPNRWTHHVVLSDPSQIDDELMDWIRESYDFSAAKRQSR